MFRYHWVRTLVTVAALALILMDQTTAWADDKRRMVTVKPVALDAPASAWAGEWITVTWSLVNDGTEASGRNMVAWLYLSATPDMVGPTFLLSRVPHTRDLAARETMTISQRVQVPRALLGGCAPGADRACDTAQADAKIPPPYREVTYYLVLGLDRAMSNSLVQPIRIKLPYTLPDSQP